MLYLDIILGDKGAKSLTRLRCFDKVADTDGNLGSWWKFIAISAQRLREVTRKKTQSNVTYDEGGGI